MLTVSLLLVLAAFVCVIGAAMGRVQLWIAVLLLVRRAPARLVAGALAALPLASCGLSLSHSATFSATPPRCADGFPPIVLQALTCPDGYCGFTCAPGRWEARVCP